MKKLVFVTRRIPDAGLNLLKARKDVMVRINPQNRVMSASALRNSVRGAAAILPLLTDKIDKQLMVAAGPQLQVISNFAVGYNNIDVAEAVKRGIKVSNSPGQTITDAVAEHTLALVMAATRRIAEGDRVMRSGKYKGWDPNLLTGTQLTGKTLGILGLGRIGKGLAQRAIRGLGMKVVYWNLVREPAFEKEFGAQYMAADDVVKNADILSLHVLLNKETTHLIDARRLKLMKKTAYLINTSRGPVVDEKALAAALKAKRIAGAGIDVYEFEPKPAPGLAALPNIVMTPHIGSATLEARDEMAVVSCQAILDVFDGKTPKFNVTAQ